MTPRMDDPLPKLRLSQGPDRNRSSLRCRQSFSLLWSWRRRWPRTCWRRWGRHRSNCLRRSSEFVQKFSVVWRRRRKNASVVWLASGTKIWLVVDNWQLTILSMKLDSLFTLKDNLNLNKWCPISSNVEDNCGFNQMKEINTYYSSK